MSGSIIVIVHSFSLVVTVTRLGLRWLWLHPLRGDPTSSSRVEPTTEQCQGPVTGSRQQNLTVATRACVEATARPVTSEQNKISVGQIESCLNCTGFKVRLRFPSSTVESSSTGMKRGRVWIPSRQTDLKTSSFVGKETEIR